MARRADITQQELKQLLRYDRETGEWTWRVHKGPRYPGDPAGTISKGYVRICLNGKRYLGHVLAWLYVKGVWPDPDMEIDHKDTNRANNRWKNLRLVSRCANRQNQRRPHSVSTTGFLGVSFDSHKPELFRAHLTVNGKQVRLGSYPTAEQAHKAYLKAKRKLHEGNTL